VVFEEALERLEHLDFAGDAGLRGRLSLHHRHPQRPLVPRHEALQVFQQKPGVVAFRLQLRDLFLPLQQVFARLVQFLGQRRKLLVRNSAL